MPKLKPEPTEIGDHLRHITRRWHELGEPCMLEVVFLTPDDVAEVKGVYHYEPTDVGLADAADHISKMNPHHLNAYAVVNPVSAANPPKAGKRASREHILASFFHWADADDAQAAENIRSFVGPKCTFYVLTGTVPSHRPHVYWELEEPTLNLPAWEATQQAIAATLATDSVHDAPRIMRLAGTINWPKPKKQGKGYIAETTSLHLHSSDDRPPVSSERLARAFSAGAAPRNPPGGVHIDIDTGPEPLDRALAAANILADHQWRENVKRLVASYVARGWTDEEIIHRCDAFTLEGYTIADTREDVIGFIKWTRTQEAKKPKPEDEAFKPFEEATSEQKEEFGPDADANADQKAEPRNVAPADIWGVFPAPRLPRGILPKVIEDFAFIHGEQMGADPCGLAAAALCVCCAAIPDSVKVKVKRHEEWAESARIWVALVGDPSTKKSPILSTAEKPLRTIDAELYHAFMRRKNDYDALKKDEKAETERPKQVRRRLEDTTIEAAQEVMCDSPDGVLVVQDELSGWFGGMDRYSNGKGRDRSFWLQAFNGGVYAYNRVGRGAGMVANLSACVLGGIQPAPIRRVVAEATDDGLIQRLFPIVLKPATLGSEDAPPTDALTAYGAAVRALTMCEVGGGFAIDTGHGGVTLRFSDGAQTIRRKLEERHLELMAIECVSRKLAAHIGKYDGLFARLCVAFHCIENSASGIVPNVVDEDTARRVARILHRFFLPHAIAFYNGVLDLSDDHDRLAAVAGYILAHGLETVNARDVARGDSTMRRLTRTDTMRLFEQLEALGWVAQQPTPARVNAAPSWIVNPEVHLLFAERRETEVARRLKARERMHGAMKCED